MSLQYNEGHPITKTCSKPSVLSYFFPFFPRRNFFNTTKHDQRGTYHGPISFQYLTSALASRPMMVSAKTWFALTTKAMTMWLKRCVSIRGWCCWAWWHWKWYILRQSCHMGGLGMLNCAHFLDSISQSCAHCFDDILKSRDCTSQCFNFHCHCLCFLSKFLGQLVIFLGNIPVIGHFSAVHLLQLGHLLT